ncbi:MAG: FMN-binding glutamate synthase family protein [Cellvibrionaceae bacterium]
MFDSFTMSVLSLISFLFVSIFAGLIILAAIFYVIDITQKTHTIRSNYPVIGRFRYFFEHIGEFLRPYWFATDREELPFNRADRQWVYRAAKNVDSSIAFGSTRDLNETGVVMFMNSAFPTLDEDALTSSPVTIGPYCETPYSTASIFNISGMSYGAISKPAVMALSNGAAKAGCWLNTGEGGLSPYHLEGGADIVFQIGTAKYGVRGEDGKLCDKKLKKMASHQQVKMFEIKLSQGAKPGKGGILPAEKVSKEVADIRGIKEGEASLSPNRHVDIDSNADLLDMIERIRRVTGKPVGFKLVVGDELWIDDLFNEIRIRGIESAPDFITVDSADGGTGASPQPLMDYVGLPIKESLPWIVDRLTEQGLRKRIKVIVAGKLINPSGVAWALALGADFVTSARGFMFALGCIQALQCNKNTCPTGVATHNPKLQRGLNTTTKAERVAQYHHNLIHSVGLIAHSCGVSEPRQLQRKHVRVVTDSGYSIGFEKVFPIPTEKADMFKPKPKTEDNPKINIDRIAL